MPPSINLGQFPTVEDDIHLIEDDKASVSRSKLVHLMELAEDDRMLKTFWNLDGAFFTFSLGLFFTSLGGCISYDTLSINMKIAVAAGLVSGATIALYCGIKKAREFKKRNKFKGKLANKIREIIQQMDEISKVKQKQKDC